MMDDSTVSSESEFLASFAPIRDVNGSYTTIADEKLPLSHDQSWIGARLSPIAFAGEEEEDDTITAPYRVPYEKKYERSGINERSALLGKKPKHPLWDEENPLLHWSSSTAKPQDVTGTLGNSVSSGAIVWVLSGMHLAAILLHDVYLAYISMRTGGSSQHSVTWSWPLMAPSAAVLIRFGAFSPYRIANYMEFWRIATAILLPTSLVEYFLIVLAWQALVRGGSRPTRIWILLYLFSIMTGQVWMMAFDNAGMGGCASWGTAGVICAAGGAKPRQRFVLFMISAILVAESYYASTQSVIGAIGATFFGWTYYGLGWGRVVSRKDKDAVKPAGSIRLVSFLALLKLWVVPMLVIAFNVPQNIAMMTV